MDRNITVSAPINIALVKYWGKRDVPSIIPMNNSISLTLDQNKLKSTTFLRVTTNINESEIILNDKKALITPRMQTMFKYAINKSCVDPDKKDKIRFQIKSINNFPTAAGLASSASGLAALAFALGKVFDLSEKDVSILARLGSGSATRSVFGGIVEWQVNTNNNNNNNNEEMNKEESRSVQLYAPEYWPQLRVLICIVSSAEKRVPSTGGMQTSVATSQLLRYRYTHCVAENLERIRRALSDKDFAELGAVTMRESNQLHAVCLDTVPPIVYLNSASFAIIDFVHAFNTVLGSTRLAYTFDAGPNAFLLYQDHDDNLLRYWLNHSFDVATDKSDLAVLIDDDNLQRFVDGLPRSPGIIESIIATSIGHGPRQCHMD